MARISKGTAVILIGLICAAAGVAVLGIVHNAHAKEDRAGRVWVKTIGPCVRRSAYEARSLAGIESAKSVDGSLLAFKHDCYEEAHALAKRSHAGASVVAALERYATETLDFEKAALDFQLYVGSTKRRVDTGKGKKLAAAAAVQRDKMIDAEAALSVRLDKVFNDEIASLGSVTPTQRSALVIAFELESIANNAERVPPKADEIAESAKKIQALGAHDPTLRAKLANVAPWLDAVVETGLLPADTDPDPAPRVFWEMVTP